MSALTVGITTARSPECKRGLSVNVAVSLARDPARTLSVCVVDADPLNLDVTTRLTVRGPVLEDFADGDAPPSSAVGSIHEPPLWVLPSAGAGVGLASRATPRALQQLRTDFDVVVCDLLACNLLDGRSESAGIRLDRHPDQRDWHLDQLDWLLVAVTPRSEPVSDAAVLIDQLLAAKARGDIAASVGIGVVITGDEGTVDLDRGAVGELVAAPVVGSVRQLWGRTAPNLGFGAALGIADLDDAVGTLFDTLSGAPTVS